MSLGSAPARLRTPRRLRASPAMMCLLIVTASACRDAPHAEPGRRPNILLVTIDTLRADRIGTGVAPVLDRLASASVRFTAARTAVPLTLPSHVSLHTGLLPPAHGVRQNGVALAGSPDTLAGLLKAAGYDTAAFVGAFVLDRRFGLAAGFDIYDDQIRRDPITPERLEAERPASTVIDRAIAWLAPRLDGPTRGPFFAWIHLYDPHAPYQAPEEFRARARTPYDAEIAYADAQLARVFDQLRTAAQLDRTLVVVAGDHGEGLGEHGERTHGMLVYDSTLRVPLIVAAPGQTAATRNEAVSLTDVAPTILRAAGVSVPDAMKGRDLLAAPARAADRDLYSETEYPHVFGWSPVQALTDGRWKAMRAGSAVELYDLQRDPLEEHDLSAAQASVATAMAGRAALIHASAGSSAAPALSNDAQERLRALGYVTSSAHSSLDRNAPNPATRIAAWNEFEDALPALTARRPDALPTLKRLAATNIDAPVVQSTYARALKQAGQTQAALDVYRQAARRWPADSALMHDLAVAARDAAAALPPTADAARTMREEAMRADRAALAIDPNSALAHNGLGLLAIDDGRAAEAAKSFEAAAASDPGNAEYWSNLGNARRGLGDHAGAEQAYRRALDVDARSADAANGLGVLLVEANRAADAVPYFERAIAAAPDLVEARLNLGIALQQSGQAARAAAAYRDVLAAPSRNKRERDAAAKLLASLGAPR